MDSKPTFRMSSAGRCPRALSAQLLSVEAEPIPSFVMQAAEEGNWHEERIKNHFANSGWDIHDEQKEVVLEYPSFNLVGHIDGTIDNIADRTLKLLEIKTMSQFEFDRWMKGGFKAFPNYADQVTCYMEATGLNECLYIVKNRSSGYEDRRIITEQPSNFDAIIGKLADVVQDISNSRPAFQLSYAEFDPQSIECRRCEYRKLCIPEPKELTPIDELNLSNAVRDWRDGKDLVAQGQRLIDNAKDTFNDHTRATNIFKWSFNKLAIQLVHYNESVTYLKAKLLKEFTEEQLEPASQVKEAFDQLRITDLEKDNGS